MSCAIVCKNNPPQYINLGSIKCSSNRAVNEHTVYNIASVSKGFTTLAVMLLREQSKIIIDAPVTTYLPWFQTFDKSMSDKITVRHLMQHASGLPSDAHKAVYQKYRAKDLDTEIRNLGCVELRSEPGSRFIYSNMNFHILQYLIEIVSEMPFQAFMREYIFERLGMYRTGYQTDVKAGRNKSSGHKIIKNTIIPSNHSLPERLWGEGGVFTTTADLSNYIKMLLSGGMVGNGRFINTETLQEMHTGTIKSDRQNSNYGLGWFVTKETVEHFGSAPHFTAKIVLCPNQNLGYVLVSNAGNNINHVLCDNIKKLIFGEQAQVMNSLVQIKTRFVSRLLRKMSIGLK